MLSKNILNHISNLSVGQQIAHFHKQVFETSLDTSDKIGDMAILGN